VWQQTARFGHQLKYTKQVRNQGPAESLETRSRKLPEGHRERPNNRKLKIVEVTKALAALQPLYGKDNVEIVTDDGNRVRGIVRSMKTTQALTKPSVKMERADGEIVKIPFTNIIKIIDHNYSDK
jgi:predicted RNA-binding protein with PUA domain